MNGYNFTLAGVPLCALASGALWWPDKRLLCVSDLHLGKSERIAQRGGVALPPYDTRDTLNRLTADLTLTGAAIIVCLGNSFDDLGPAQSLPESESLWISRLQAGQRWVWITGPHTAGPTDIGGTHLAELPLAPLSFRHIARPGASGEVSGHYHPTSPVQTPARTIAGPAFLADRDRVILPSYGPYSAEPNNHEDALEKLMRPEAVAILTGKTPHAVPMIRD